MSDLTADQRLANVLLELLPQLAQQQSAAAQNATVTAADSPAMSSVLRTIADRYDETGARLSGIIEALAAGMLLIVDEYALVKTLERVIREDREARERQSPLRVAQLAHQELSKNGAIR